MKNNHICKNLLKTCFFNEWGFLLFNWFTICISSNEGPTPFTAWIKIGTKICYLWEILFLEHHMTEYIVQLKTAWVTFLNSIHSIFHKSTLSKKAFKKGEKQQWFEKTGLLSTTTVTSFLTIPLRQFKNSFTRWTLRFRKI